MLYLITDKKIGKEPWPLPYSISCLSICCLGSLIQLLTQLSLKLGRLWLGLLPHQKQLYHAQPDQPVLGDPVRYRPC